MAIKIETSKPEIPIEIGKLKFAFDVSDESVSNFRKNAANIQKELESIEIDEKDENVQESTKEVLRRGYDFILGKGSFDKIYEQTPSIVYVANFFVQIVEGLKEELEEMGFSESQQEKAKKYIQAKK